MFYELNVRLLEFYVIYHTGSIVAHIPFWCGCVHDFYVKSGEPRYSCPCRYHRKWRGLREIKWPALLEELEFMNNFLTRKSS